MVLAKFNLAKALFQKAKCEKDKVEKKIYLKQSIGWLDKVLQKEKEAEYILLKSKIYFYFGDSKKALEFCNEALEMDSSIKEIFAIKQKIEEKLGNITKAIQAHESYESIVNAEGNHK